jgi:cytochrome b
MRAESSGARLRGSQDDGERLVWDWPLRLTHWLLVLCVAGSFATHYAGIEWFRWHQRCGYAVFVLVAFRLCWGLVGPRHARFASFVRGPRAIIDYLRGRGAARSAVGHNPLGALAVLALLGVLGFQAVTGLYANDEIANAGAWYGWVDQELSNRLTGLHQDSSNVLLLLFALHIAAIAWYTLHRRQPLVRAMWTGRKPAATVPAAEAIERSGGWLAALIALAIAAVLAASVQAAPEATIALF